MLLDKLKTLFGETPAADNTPPLALAEAALLLELSLADSEQDPRELEKLRQLLVQGFGVDTVQLDNLIEEASSAQRDSASLYPFTQELRERLSGDERAELVEAMWDMAFADGQIDKHEEQLIRKVADLLYVPHSRFMQGKLAAQQRHS